MNIRIAYLGRSYQLADAIPDQIELPDEGTIADAVRTVRSCLPEGELAASCLVTVSGRHVGSVAQFTDAPLHDGDELVLIAPVAGG